MNVSCLEINNFIDINGTFVQLQPFPWPPSPSLLTASFNNSTYLAACHLVFSVIGIPLNLYVIGIILALERLHLMRTFTWLGVGFSNVLVFIHNLVELQIVYWPNPVADLLYTWFNGLPYLFLKLNYIFAIVERHLCLKHPLFYKRHVTSCWTILAATQTGSWTIVSIIVTQRYFFEECPFDGQMGPLDLKIAISMMLPICVMCIAAHLSLWSTCSGDHPSARTARIMLRRLSNGRNVEENLDGSTPDGADAAQSPFVRIGGERVSRLDLEAARNLTINGLILLVVFVPVISCFALMVGCFDLVTEETADCASRYVELLLYVRELIYIPCSSISPISFVMQSRDIRSALRDRGLRWV